MRKKTRLLERWKAGASDFLFDRLEPLAVQYRSILKKVTFIGITGSYAKTTTKNLIASILRGRARTSATKGTLNSPPQIIKTILRTTPFHHACVIELGAGGPGSLDRGIRLAAPSVAVITHVGLDHYTAFRSREAVAAEKSKLVAALPPTGVAVLNADDPFVLAMGEQTAARKILFSASSPDADLWASHIRSSWPERLIFTVHTKNGDFPVETKLCGKHWVSAVLAALGAALAMNLTLEEALPFIAVFEPPQRRMSSLPLGSNIFVIRDDYKAPYLSVPSCLDFLRDARAKRKIFILGTLSDYPGNSSRKYRNVLKEGLTVADKVFLIGPLWAYIANKLGDTGFDGRARGFVSMDDLARHLCETSEPGDLILLKGARKPDQFDRLVDILKKRLPS